MLISIETYITCDWVAAQTVLIVELAYLIKKSTMIACWSNSGEITSGCTYACSDYCIICPYSGLDYLISSSCAHIVKKS